MKHFWEHWKELVADTVVVLLGLGLLYHFFWMFVLGYYVAREPSRPLVVVEMTALVLMIALGVDRFLGDMRHRR